MNNSSEGAASAAAPRSNLDILKDIELPVSLRFGSTRMILQELVRLHAGSVIQLDGAPGDPVELLVNGLVVARGEAVIVQNSYGIRISEIAGERIAASGFIPQDPTVPDPQGDIA